MPINLLAVLVAALSSFGVGFIWYNPKVFGTIWMEESGMTDEKAKKANMAKIFGFTFVYAFMLAFMMSTIVIHQMGALSLIGGPDMIATAKPSYAAFIADYGDAFRTYKHGALHGFISGIFIALPIIEIYGLFDQKSWKLMAIQAGYWTVIMTIMGAIICGWK